MRGFFTFHRFRKLPRPIRKKIEIPRVILEDLPYFATKDFLMRHFERYGPVQNVYLMHTKEGDYTRSAILEMEFARSVKKIRREVNHLILEKRITVKTYSRMPKIKRYVEGTYELHFENLFVPFRPLRKNQKAIDSVAVQAYRRLENAFHKYKFSKIRIFCEESENEDDENGYDENGEEENGEEENGYEETAFPHFTGNGCVYFLDDKDKRKIMKVAKRKFKRCKITEITYDNQNGPDLELGSDPT